MKLLKIILPLLVLVAGAVGAVGLVKSRDKVETQATEPYAPAIRTVIARQGEHHLYVYSQGSVTARTETDLVAEIAGRVTWLSDKFAVGGYFEAGERLLSLDPRDYDLAITRAKAQVAEARQRQALTQAEAEQARFEWQKLGKKGSPSPLVVKKPQLAEAKAKLEAAQADLAIARLNRERVEIRAPYAGYIRQKQADLGLYLRPGSVVARFYALDRVEVRLPLHDEQLHFLAHDFSRADAEPINVTLSSEFAGQRLSWSSRIVRSEGLLDNRSRLLYLVAEVDNSVANTDQPPLTPGLFVNAKLEGRRLQQVFSLPRATLYDPEHLLVIDANQRLHLRKVEIARLERETVVIRRGLESGERVSLSKVEAAVEGMKVKLLDEI